MSTAVPDSGPLSRPTRIPVTQGWTGETSREVLAQSIRRIQSQRGNATGEFESAFGMQRQCPCCFFSVSGASRDGHGLLSLPLL
mmetsp:Transcript_136111/g.250469  ORF Transcript_136111/g.250469 Transcript_136111/m.250469 type:complete len:84 (-) Transcript_136111:1052-1303(-)